MTRVLLVFGMAATMFAVSMSNGYAQRDSQSPPAAASSCPGQPGPAPLATGVYTKKPVAEIVINGQPAPGAIWKAGDRAFWHCHSIGQLLFLHEGVGRVQQQRERGARARRARHGDLAAHELREPLRDGQPEAAAVVPARELALGLVELLEHARQHVVVDADGVGAENELVGQHVSIGSVVLDVIKPIDRCVMTTRPQPGGIERDLDVLRTINAERQSWLGVGALVLQAGSLAVGDEVLVAERAD